MFLLVGGLIYMFLIDGGPIQIILIAGRCFYWLKNILDFPNIY